jgi:hypothetical protein
MISFTLHLRWGVSWLMAMLLAITMILSGCSGGDTVAGVGTGGTGTIALAKLDVTDAPASDYVHVYVTVVSVAFHTNANASFSDYSSATVNGWQITQLDKPRTIDLAQLTNGTMYADTPDSGGSALFSGITLPNGSYGQIRIFLASTEDSLTKSASSLGLTYNNEVQQNGDATHYPLRVPAASEGIKITPESPISMSAGSNVSLALDFNLTDDVVEVTTPAGATEFIFKPRLGYFDMGSVGAVKGTITSSSFANLSTSKIEVKAEHVKTALGYRVVRRQTAVDKATGKFILYPLPVFNNNSTATYDILIRGRNVQTAIVKKVKVHKGTTAANGVDLGTITMQPGTEFTAQLPTGSHMHPSGAWLSFYQTIANDSVPYEVRYRHLNPYTGILGDPIELSTESIQVATFNPGGTLTFTVDNTSKGTFSMVADASADLYDPGTAITGITGSAGSMVPIAAASNSPPVDSSATAGTISCTFDMALLGSGTGAGMGKGRSISLPTKGQMLVTHGGMIIDSLGTLSGDSSVATAMQAGSAVTISNIPSHIPQAVYGVYVLGWSNSVLVAGDVLGVDLSSGNATAIVKLK